MRNVALAVAAVAILAPLARADGATFDYRFGWREIASPFTTLGNETAEGTEEEVPVEIALANLTVARFTLTWSDDVGDPDSLRLTVRDPSGAEHGPVNATAGEDGELVVTARVAEMPPGTVTVRASSDEEAWAVFQSKYPDSWAGAGTWTVLVAVDDAGDEEGGVLGLGGEADPGEDWELGVDVATFEGALEEKVAVAPEAPPTPNPTEMPPVEEPPAEEPPIADPPETQDGFLATPGGKSALVVGAAALGVACALAIGRKAAA